ncbi:hypothetical protein VARIO8X_120064 [Burkholderiales bacterium 8X]|nr:hypothetical protein VARIO8X_120064 [Burkholderiales bacterium 8X]
MEDLDPKSSLPSALAFEFCDLAYQSKLFAYYGKNNKMIERLQRTSKAAHAAAPQTWLQVPNWKQLADKMGYTCKRSSSLKRRVDQSLKGVVILMAQATPSDAVLAGCLAEFIQHATAGGEHRNDKLLVEAAAHDQERVYESSHGWRPLETCIGIDDEQLAQSRDSLALNACNAGVALLARMAELGSELSRQELVAPATGLDRIVTRWVKADKQVQDATQEEFFEFYTELERYLKNANDVDKLRCEAFLKKTKAHAGPDHATYVILQASHVNALKDALLAEFDALMMAPRDHLGMLTSDQREFAAWEDTASESSVPPGTP